MTLPVLKASHLSKKYNFPCSVEVLRHISLEVYEKETVAIMGRSGEGKSTLLHILGTLESPCSGELEICGLKTTPSNIPLIRNSHIGFIFQDYNLLEDCTVLENVLMPAKIGRLDTRKDSPAYLRAMALLKEVGLIERALFPAKLLSGGEKQRATFARALLNDPDLILADEPSGNLDHSTSIAIHTLLINCAKKQNKTLIVVTHDKDLAKLCDRTYQLTEGTLIEV